MSKLSIFYLATCFLYFGNVGAAEKTTKVDRRPAEKGAFFCRTSLEGVEALEAFMNQYCDTTKQFSISAVLNNFRPQHTFCCIGR